MSLAPFRTWCTSTSLNIACWCPSTNLGNVPRQGPNLSIRFPRPCSDLGPRQEPITPPGPVQTWCPCWCRGHGHQSEHSQFKILDAAALRKAVTSERAWVGTATTIQRDHGSATKIDSISSPEFLRLKSLKTLASSLKLTVSSPLLR